MRGKKSEAHRFWFDPPRCRANKRRGRGTFANDRPPILGVVGRDSGQLRLAVAADTKGKTVCGFVEHFTQTTAIVYTDESNSYNHLDRTRYWVSHEYNEWARDDNGDGIRETHSNTMEGVWTGLRNFLRPFRGVSKYFLHGYVAIYQARVNHKAISPTLIASLVRLHST
jgi:transposase-like protein